ncbi:lytic transglycosylase domain-containing protein, partial [Acidobacteria bacterium AH-259-L09]|nr:lytic transglycosylase domain-containing protein [Acidobacteria bacterium AH-259-L09]
MSLREKAKWWSLILVVGLLAGLLSFAYQTDYGKMESEIAALSEKNQVLIAENQRLRYINNLAVEFSMDPMIVELVEHYSHEYLKGNGPEWRLLKTPEFMTYIMLSLIYAESKGDASAVGDGGRARGLTQIWVSTARDYGEVTAEKLLDPETNISFAFKHFHHLLKKYSGNLALALYAWNRGSTKVDKLLIYGRSPQNGYARKVY